MARTSTSSGSEGVKADPAEQAGSEEISPVQDAKASKAGPAKKSAPAEARARDGREPERSPATKAAKASRAAKAPTGGERSPAGSGPAAPTKAAPAKAAPAAGGYAGEEEFLAAQREALLAERATYLEQAQALRAEAESLVNEAEPGDVQFDEESGEGGTMTVDRERDLALSAQALAAVEEIGAALEKIDQGRYGVCEGCGELIPKPRLEALPYARLCIACKSGGLSRR